MSDYNFNFQAYQERARASRIDPTTIRYRESGKNARVTLGPLAHESLGCPTYYSVEYDAKQQAIRLIPRSEKQPGGLKVQWPSKAGVTATLTVSRLRGVMPQGTYLPIDTGIFVHESAQR